jgi:integrase
LERFRKLVKFWQKQQWISHDLGVYDIQPPIGANEAAERFPFTDDELERFYRACDELGEVRWMNGFGTRSWSGQDVKDFIILSIYTGLRISDVGTFDVAERLDGNDIFIRAKKNGKRLYTWVPDWVRDILLDRQRRLGSKIFQLGESERLETITDLWRRKLERIFSLAQKDGGFKHKPVPHRFRHTFVRILLAAGVPVADVAELAGDTEEVIVRYYAKWVPERQERLRNILKDAFKTKPKLIVVSRRKPA